MAILNYTTKIDAPRTVGEIQAMLASKGARRIGLDYDEKGVPVAIEFQTDTDLLGMMFYRYAPDVAGVLAAMEADRAVPARLCELEHARRVAWRIEKDWLLAQFAKIEATSTPLEKLMLPYMVTPSGQTLFEMMAINHKALPAIKGVIENG